MGTESRLRKQERDKQVAHDDTKREYMEKNQKQADLRDQMRQHQAKEEQSLREQMLDKFAEDRALDQEAAARRANERSKFTSDIGYDKQVRSNMYTRELISEQKKRAAEEEEKAFKQKVIEAARKRLLQQHAHDLGGFLPKGVLAKAEDLALIGA